jgi:flagellar hook-basal body complex protein FliE
MALNLSSISSALLPNAASQIAALTRASVAGPASGLGGDAGDGSSGDDFLVDAATGLLGAGKAAGSAEAMGGAAKGGSFEQALLKAMDGVSASQNKSDNLLQQVVADPNSVDAQDVTIAMAEANMSLNLAKTILSRVVTAWKDVINTH